MRSTLFRSSHLFFYVGIALVLLSLVFLPAKIKVGGTPEQVDVDYYSVGWFFAFTIGSYGLASLVLGVIEVSISKKKNLTIFESIFLVSFFGLLIYIWTGFIALSALYVGFNGLGGLLTFMVYLVPSIVVTLALFIGVANKKYLVRVLDKKSVKIVVSIIMIAFPLTFIANVLQSTVLVFLN